MVVIITHEITMYEIMLYEPAIWEYIVQLSGTSRRVTGYIEEMMYTADIRLLWGRCSNTGVFPTQ